MDFADKDLYYCHKCRGWFHFKTMAGYDKHYFETCPGLVKKDTWNKHSDAQKEENSMENGTGTELAPAGENKIAKRTSSDINAYCVKMSETVNFYFILSDKFENEFYASDDMQQAFELCRQNQLDPKWITEEKCKTTEFVKKDVIVFEKFEGDIFKKLVSQKCFIAGPRCVITCIQEELPVPNNGSPVYTMAMNKVVVAASSLTKEDKIEIKRKIELMGGMFLASVTNSVTHLITNSVTSEKYSKANELGKKVMLMSWVTDVWNSNLKRHIKATDPEFDRHKCPIFHNLEVSTTGFTAFERESITKRILANGGYFNGRMCAKTTNVLIHKIGSNNEKFKIARKYKVPIVSIDWIDESVEKGYNLPIEEFIIKATSSTPTKLDAGSKLNFSVSTISHLDVTDLKDSCSETVFSFQKSDLFCEKENELPSNSKVAKENEVLNLIDKIDMDDVKKAGPFLDGSGIYIFGFSPEHREKLCRVLKMAGATRYDIVTNRVTHIILAHPDPDDVKYLCLGEWTSIVNIEWLIECIKQRQLVPDGPFSVKNKMELEPPSSPLSKKGLTLLQNDVSPPRFNFNSPTINENDTLAQYFAQGHVNINITEGINKLDDMNDTKTVEEDESLKQIFKDKTFKLVDFDEDEKEYEKLCNIVEDMMGKVVSNSFKGITDYIVMPVITKPYQKHAAIEVVNKLWLEDCYNYNELVEVQYYHQPFCVMSDAKPLTSCVISISGYIGNERVYLAQLLEHLGGIHQENFSRRTLTDKNVLASTHLVCFEMKGNKYDAAIRWNRFIVSHKWLLKCAQKYTRANEHLYRDASMPLEDSDDTTSDSETTNSSKRKRSLLSEKQEYFSFEKNALNDDNSITKKRERKLSKLDAEASVMSKTSQCLDQDVFANQNTETLNNVEMEFASESDSDILIKLEDGKQVYLNDYLAKLREDGLFDTPSPAPKFTGTPFSELLSRLKRDGEILTKKASAKNLASEFKEIDDSQRLSAPSTPVSRFLRDLKERNVLPSTPKSNDLPKCSFDIKTPDTPYGCFIEENPSAETRKRWKRYLDRVPVDKRFEKPRRERRPSTPLSEVKRQVWAWLLREESDDGNDQQSTKVQKSSAETDSQDTNNCMDQLRSITSESSTTTTTTSSSGSTMRAQSTTTLHESHSTKANKEVDTQPESVGWVDDSAPTFGCNDHSVSTKQNIPFKKFSLSGLEPSVRTSCCEIIKRLGGLISDTSYYDSTLTHVVCEKVTRNEKVLSSIAAGKWILHISYIKCSQEEGHFLNEENYEFGNPKATSLKYEQITPIIDVIHYWRLRALETGHGAFYGIRALIFASCANGIARLVEAGEGVVINATPPFEHNVDATHCFVDLKFVINHDELIPLAEQNILCLNVLYLNTYLTSRSVIETKKFILKGFEHYYNM